jgi:hypothetical protein
LVPSDGNLNNSNVLVDPDQHAIYILVESAVIPIGLPPVMVLRNILFPELSYFKIALVVLHRYYLMGLCLYQYIVYHL